MSIQHMLTTTDNPFDPFTQYEEWDRFDQDAGYYTPAYLARVALTSDDMSEADQQLAIELAIDEICELNVLGLYRKLSKEIE